MTAPSIPPEIPEQDHTLWQSWLASLASSQKSYITIRQYKISVIGFTAYANKSIAFITEQDISNYACSLAGKAPSTISKNMSAIRQYWNFAQKSLETRDMY